MKTMLIILSMLFIFSNCFTQSNLLLLDSDDAEYYMKSNADSVVLHIVFDTLYTRTHGLDSVNYDLSPRGNNMTGNFIVKDYLSYSPVKSKGTSVHFQNFNKFIRDTTYIKDKDFRMGMQSFTLEAIIKTTFYSADDTKRDYWLCKHDGTSPNSGYFMTHVPTNGRHYIKVQDDEGLTNGGRETEVNVCDGKWHYLVAEYNRSKKDIYTYVDGVLNEHYPKMDLTNVRNLNAPKAQLTIGGLDSRQPHNANGWFVGEIAEVRITRDTLGVKKILGHWNKIKNASIDCPIPKTLTAVINQSDNLELSSNENMADTTFWYKGTEANPTAVYKKVCRGAAVIDLAVNPGTVYHYRSRNKRIGMNGKPVLSDYSDDITVTALESRGERIKASIDRTFEPVQVYTSNFTAGADGWTVAGASGVWNGNISAYGRTGLLRSYIVNGSGQTQQISYKALTGINNMRLACSFDFFAPSYLSLAGNLGMRDAAQSLYFIQKDMRNNNFEGAWTKARGNGTNTDNNQVRLYLSGTAGGDSLYYQNVLVSQLSNWTPAGNYTADTTTLYKYLGSYSIKAVSPGASDGSANYLYLDTLRFAQLKPDSSNSFSIRARTASANTIMYLNIGNQTQSFNISDSWVRYSLNFTTSAGEVKKRIKIWFSQAATVYLDGASLK